MKSARLTPSDPRWSLFVAALQAADLPTDDLGDAGQSFFAFEDGAAFGGYMRDGDIALIRSVVTPKDRRSAGAGSRGVTALVDEMIRAGVREAWLLTTTASAFFERHGFREANRADAPEAVTRSRQFSLLCPSSAVLMCRTLR